MQQSTCAPATASYLATACQAGLQEKACCSHCMKDSKKVSSMRASSSLPVSTTLKRESYPDLLCCCPNLRPTVTLLEHGSKAATTRQCKAHHSVAPSSHACHELLGSLNSLLVGNLPIISQRHIVCLLSLQLLLGVSIDVAAT